MSIFLECKEYVKVLEGYGYIKNITMEDVFVELKSQVLAEEEMIALLRWWINYKTKTNVAQVDAYELSRLARICVEDTEQPLSSIRFFLNPSIIPAGNNNSRL
jgi:Protein of unknown function (DUF3684)